MRSPHLRLAKEYWKSHLRPGDLAVDATCGNGHDTLALCELGAKVIALDVQEAALAHTRERLKHQGKSATLLLHSHAPLPPLPAAPRLIVYNLGYLPGGDKGLTTQTHTTLLSVQESLTLLTTDGALSIMCYPGHEEGAREERALLSWVQDLPSHWKWTHHKWREETSHPSLLWIQGPSAPSA